MANSKTNVTREATVLSKTASGEHIIVSLQGAQGAVHTLYLTKDEAKNYELGDSVTVSLKRE